MKRKEMGFKGRKRKTSSSAEEKYHWPLPHPPPPERCIVPISREEARRNDLDALATGGIHPFDDWQERTLTQPSTREPRGAFPESSSSSSNDSAVNSSGEHSPVGFGRFGWIPPPMVAHPPTLRPPLSTRPAWNCVDEGAAFKEALLRAYDASEKESRFREAESDQPSSSSVPDPGAGGASAFPSSFLSLCKENKAMIKIETEDDVDAFELMREPPSSSLLCPWESAEKGATLSLREPTVSFTDAEADLIDFVRVSRNRIVGKINNVYHDSGHRDELTAILMSRGAVKPSFRFMERVNRSIMASSLELVDEILTMFDMPPKVKKMLTAENVSFASLVGAAAYTHGNDAPTFVEQARLTGLKTCYVDYLEEAGLADVVPRMEAHYLNPSPWAERESYEFEFNRIMKKIGQHVGTDQTLTTLLIIAHLFCLPDNQPAGERRQLASFSSVPP